MNPIKITQRRGFTLLEIVIVIAITAILTVALFEALDRVRRNEARFRQKQETEKEIYLLYNGLSAFFKNLSQYMVFNNREETPFFQGGKEGLIGLTQCPLIAPGHGLRFAELRFDKKNRRLLYREKDFRESRPEKGAFITFEELAKEPFYPLLEDVRALEFLYFSWDAGNRRYEWKERLDTFKRDSLPRQVLLRLDHGGRRCEMSFHRIIQDRNVVIPPEKLL